MSAPDLSSKPTRVSPLNKAAVRAMAFLLQHNLMGSAGEQLMCLTTTGRKTGKSYTIPVGYVRDGETIIANTRAGGASNWYRNLAHNPQAILNIKGKTYPARATFADDPVERQNLLALYLRERASNFRGYFGVPADSSPEVLAQALAGRAFVCFHLENS